MRKVRRLARPQRAGRGPAVCGSPAAGKRRGGVSASAPLPPAAQAFLCLGMRTRAIQVPWMSRKLVPVMADARRRPAVEEYCGARGAAASRGGAQGTAHRCRGHAPRVATFDPARTSIPIAPPRSHRLEAIGGTTTRLPGAEATLAPRQGGVGLLLT